MGTMSLWIFHVWGKDMIFFYFVTRFYEKNHIDLIFNS